MENLTTPIQFRNIAKKQPKQSPKIVITYLKTVAQISPQTPKSEQQINPQKISKTVPKV